MKSAYELAMERLNKSAPSVKLTAAQKKELAELDSQYAAKIAGGYRKRARNPATACNRSQEAAVRAGRQKRANPR